MKKYDVVVVGAGLAGLYALKCLREHGYSVLVLEACEDIGGTWFRNRYPGLRCDVDSMSYSYSFSDELQLRWTWSERYSTQPEILRYIHHVADRFNLRDHIRLNEKVIAAEYNETVNSWHLRTAAGNAYEAQFCIAATGCLSVPNMPKFAGLEDFRGVWYHSADWPKEKVEFAGKCVAVVGTGSSDIQMIPVIAEEAAHLTVFQRTPAYSIPAWNVPLSEEQVAEWKAHYPALRAKARTTRDGEIFDPPAQSALDVSDSERDAEFERRWRQGSFGFMAAYTDLLRSEEANKVAADFFRRKTAERIKNPARAAVLMPVGHLGIKRMCVDTNYFETYNRDNVDLIDMRTSPIVRITAAGIATTDEEYDFDTIVFATGYDAMTGALLRMNIKGRGGRTLINEWKDGPRNYLGLAMAGFPNLFTITGPHSPSVFTNVITSIEQHVEWITNFINFLKDQNLDIAEVTEAAQREWVEHAIDQASRTLHLKANSWYVGANVEGKPRMLMPYVGGFGTYAQICEEVAAQGYRGFEFHTCQHGLFGSRSGTAATQ